MKALNLKQYGLLLVIISGLTLYASVLNAAEGKISGTIDYSIPGWFKDSFLEISEDIKEASNDSKHVMLFMHLEGCPYCARMLNENFRQGKRKEFIQTDFDVIAINIRGDREVTWDQQTKYIEKSLARELKVHFTPTIVLLNAKGQKVLQLNGYRKPEALKQALEYVRDRRYLKIRFADYIKQKNTPLYRLRSNASFSKMTDFSKYKGPLAIIFEDKMCAGCDEFHEKVLNHIDVRKETEKIKLVRLDAYSDVPVIDINGNKTTAKQWAERLKLDYRPGTVLFDGGEEITRADGRLYHFHYKELLRYVSGGHYFEYPGYNQYLNVRQKQLTKSGVDIDLGL